VESNVFAGKYCGLRVEFNKRHPGHWIALSRQDPQAADPGAEIDDMSDVLRQPLLQRFTEQITDR
jgi:hypothetical protein